MAKKGDAATRRKFLQLTGIAASAAAGLGSEERAYGFSREEMSPPLAKLYRGHCAVDPMHAPTLEVAFARLDAVGIKYDRAEVAATLRCPICGCSIISNPEVRNRWPHSQPAF
jgi:hypothetical protein